MNIMFVIERLMGSNAMNSYYLNLFNFFLDLFSSSSSTAYNCRRLSISDAVFINFERNFLLMITLDTDKNSFKSLLTF